MSLIAAVLAAVPSFAASPAPPGLPGDPAVMRGTLPDGIAYYIVSNPSEKGMAEFALVRKGAPGDSLPEAVMEARASITRIPRLENGTARDYIARNGFPSTLCRRSPSGQVKVTEDAVIYRFGSFPVAGREAVVDSTLMLLFGIVAAQDSLQVVRPTSSYAVVVSGDIDRDAVLSKMKMLSLMVPSRGGNPETDTSYMWKGMDSLECAVAGGAKAGLAEIRVSFPSPRTPEEYMGSAITAVSDHLAGILDKVLKKRLYSELKRNSVPVADVSCRYRRSSDGPGDEEYSVTVRTDTACLEPALSVTASVISAVDGKGILPKEFADARNEYMIQLYRQSLDPLTCNRKYVDACISSFLYGASIVKKSDTFEFLSRGQMPDSTRARLFNNFASELLDSACRLTVTVPEGHVSDRSRIKTLFVRSWEDAAQNSVYTSYSVNMSDSLAFGDRPSERLKVVRSRPEPVSGGSLWEFSNGMKVVYKRMATGGLFYYDLMIRGGYSAMEDIKKGEGAFLADMLETYDIDGLRSGDFNRLLLSEGITMSSRVTVSDLNIAGMAPRPSLTLLMKALVAVAEGRTIDPDAFAYYRQCEALRIRAREGSLRDRITAIDSLMCPSYNYSSNPAVEALYPDLQDRAMKFFDSQFSRANDGVLVIVGDMEETAMRRFLQKHLGGFSTMPLASVRIRLPYQPISGWTTHIREGRRQSVEVAMSAQLPFTAENYMALQVASMAVEDAMEQAMCGRGVSVRVLSDFSAYPQERINLMISLTELDPDSLPLDERQRGPIVLLYRVRSVLSSLSGMTVPDDRIALYRDIVKNNVLSLQQDPQYWIEAVRMRYSFGKDLNTKYAEKTDAVTGETVKEIISMLNSGSKVEYVVR